MALPPLKGVEGKVASSKLPRCVCNLPIKTKKEKKKEEEHVSGLWCLLSSRPRLVFFYKASICCMLDVESCLQEISLS